MFKQYEKSDVYRNVQRATQLLSKDFEITNDHLRSTQECSERIWFGKTWQWRYKDETPCGAIWKDAEPN